MSQERRKDFHRAYKYRPRSETTSANLICLSRPLGKQRCAAKELGNPNRCVTKEQNYKVLHKSNKILPNSLQNQKMEAFFQIRGISLSCRGLQFAALPRVETGGVDEWGKARRGNVTMERLPLQNMLIWIKRLLVIFPIRESFTEQQKVKLNFVVLQLPYLLLLPPSKNKTKQTKRLQASNQTKKAIKLLKPVFQGQGESHKGKNTTSIHRIAPLVHMYFSTCSTYLSKNVK